MTVWPSCRHAAACASLSCAFPSATVRPSTRPVTPTPAVATKFDARGIAMPRCSAAATIADASGCSLPRSTDDVRFRPSCSRRHGGDFGTTGGHRAGLVDDEDVDAREKLERLSVLDQHAGGGAASGAHHDRHRRRQSERARARDDQDGDGGDERVRQARFGAPFQPYGERHDRDCNDSRHEVRGDAIRKALNRCARALRVTNHADDLREQRVGADALGAHRERAVGRNGAADDALARTLVDRDRLASDHRLVDRRAAVHDDAVDRHFFAGPHTENVPHLDRVERNVDFPRPAPRVAGRG